MTGYETCRCRNDRPVACPSARLPSPSFSIGLAFWMSPQSLLRVVIIGVTSYQLSSKCISTQSCHTMDIILQWRHNWRDGVSNHQPHNCLLSRLFGRKSKKHQSSASLAFVRGIHRGPVNSPHKWAVTRKMFPFDDVIMIWWQITGIKHTFSMYARMFLCTRLEFNEYGIRPWARGVHHAPPPPPPPHPYKTMFFWTLRVSTIRNEMLTVKI